MKSFKVINCIINIVKSNKSSLRIYFLIELKNWEIVFTKSFSAVTLGGLMMPRQKKRRSNNVRLPFPMPTKTFRPTRIVENSWQRLFSHQLCPTSARAQEYSLGPRKNLEAFVSLAWGWERSCVKLSARLGLLELTELKYVKLLPAWILDRKGTFSRLSNRWIRCPVAGIPTDFFAGSLGVTTAPQLR